MIFRFTAKLRRRLKVPDRQLVEPTPRTAPSEWYGNVVILRRRHFLIFTEATTLFTAWAPAAEVTSPAAVSTVFRNYVVRALNAERYDGDASTRVLDAGEDVFARARDPRVLGSMMDFINMVRFHLDDSGLDQVPIARMNDIANESPMSLIGMAPRDALARLLRPKRAR